VAIKIIKNKIETLTNQMHKYYSCIRGNKNYPKIQTLPNEMHKYYSCIRGNKNYPKIRTLTNEEIALKWFDSFNTKNLEALLSLYADDARHFSPKLKIRQPETEGWIKGKTELRNWWADAFKRLPSLHYQVNTLTANSDRIFMEYLREVEGEPSMMVAEVLEISNSKIQSSRVYHA